MKHMRLLGLAFGVMLVLSAISVASASALEPAPTILRVGGLAIPEGTTVTSFSEKGEKPTFEGSGITLECASVETNGEHGTEGVTVGKTEKTLSIKLLFMGCIEPTSKEACTSEGATEGSILTVLLLSTVYVNASKEEFVYVENEKTKGTHTGELAKFKCGTKSTTMTGCVGSKISVFEKNMLHAVSIAGPTEAEEPGGTKFNCEEKWIGLKSEQKSVELFSFLTSGKLLEIEITA